MCVNSAAYGLRTKITNLQQAIAYLGLKQVRNLAVTAGVSDLFRRGDAIGAYRRSELWRHLVTVGLAARMIAMRLRFSDFEDVFLAALLHDLGIILIDQHDNARFVRVIDEAVEGTSLCDVEKRILGYSHAELAEAVGKMWSFPEAVVIAGRYHHNPDGYRGEHLNLLRAVVVANLVCTLKGISSIGRNLLRVSPTCILGLGLRKDDLRVLAEDLDQEVAANVGLYQI
ncbi:MAG: HDOD domain-containing protein [Planctomycetota bacterium]|nr:MAG: HDOD domain-containing protein [Planctomycetota bacterium]